MALHLIDDRGQPPPPWEILSVDGDRELAQCPGCEVGERLERVVEWVGGGDGHPERTGRRRVRQFGECGRGRVRHHRDRGDRSANASWSVREIPHSKATFSAVFGMASEPYR